MSAQFSPPSAARRSRRARRGAPRSQVALLQRSRLIAAIIEAVREDGYAQLTVGKVIARSKVSRKTYYDLFCDREDGFLAAFEQVTSRVRLAVLEAYSGESTWREGVRAGLRQLLTFMDEEPALARLCVVESLGAGESVLAARAELLDQLARAIDEGRTSIAAAKDPPPLTGEAVVGGILSVLHTRLSHHSEEPLTDLLRPFMSLITLPYLGARTARRELSAPSTLPTSNGRPPVRASEPDPLKGLNLRLTYRTARVLKAIGELPGASNRDVGRGAGVVDQGQISKLLSRLARLDLIENHGPGQPRGAANAWHLTPRGRRLDRATRPY